MSRSIQSGHGALIAVLRPFNPLLNHFKPFLTHVEPLTKICTFFCPFFISETVTRCGYCHLCSSKSQCMLRAVIAPPRIQVCSCRGPKEPSSRRKGQAHCRWQGSALSGAAQPCGMFDMLFASTWVQGDGWIWDDSNHICKY